MKSIGFFGLTAFALALSCSSYAADNLTLSSPMLRPDGSIPAEHTCEGSGSPLPLTWSDPPPGTKSFALLVDDPDAPKGTFVHWVLYDIAPTMRGLPNERTPSGAHQGKNSTGKELWDPPCPPSGAHRYVFTLYALDTTIGKKGLREEDLRGAMRGHVLGQAQLVGRYQKGSR